MAILLALSSLFCVGIALLLYVQTCNLITGLTTLERFGSKGGQKSSQVTGENGQSPKHEEHNQNFIDGESTTTEQTHSKINFSNSEHYVRYSDKNAALGDRKLTKEDMGDY